MRFLIFSLICINLLFGYIKTKIINVDDDIAIINKGNLIIGQSGIILHKFKNNNETILKYAYIINSNDKNSTIKFSKIKVLPQDALPTTNLVPQKNDIFVLNHLYFNSLIIAPNYESFSTIKDMYKNFNILNPDYFAAFLKIDQNPTPDKNDIQKFCLDNQIGTIFFVINNNLYLVDTISFKIIHKQKINISNKKIQLPFYSNIDKIDSNIFNWGRIKDYNKYYSKIIGLKND